VISEEAACKPRLQGAGGVHMVIMDISMQVAASFYSGKESHFITAFGFLKILKLIYSRNIKTSRTVKAITAPIQ
jgi:hypothetical protein